MSCIKECVVKYVKRKLNSHLSACVLLFGGFLVVVSFLGGFDGCASESHKYYKAAVVEYAPIRMNAQDIPEKLMLSNANRYADIIETASTENVDIIVFPEMGLTTANVPYSNRKKMKRYLTIIPDEEDKTTPCNEKNDGTMAQHLRILSCAAQKHKMYIVVNLYEKYACDGVAQTGCPDDNIFIYNTNIVFDRTGKIIAKYRKYNLGDEPQVNRTSTWKSATFTTDFGVCFEMFIGIDILFYEPAIRALQEKKVKNIIFSSLWSSELPFLASIQVQAAYSVTNDINLLASGYNEPRESHSGSGIYSGHQGPLIITVPPASTTKLLLADIPLEPVPIQITCIEYSYYCKTKNSSKLIDILLFSQPEVEEEEYYNTTTTAIIDVAFNTTGNQFNENDIDELKLLKQNLSNFIITSLDDELSDEIAGVYQLVSEFSNSSLSLTVFNHTRDAFTCYISVIWSNYEDENRKGDEDHGYNPVYRLLAYSGSITIINGRKSHIEVCSIVSCSNRNSSSCDPFVNFNDNNSINSTTPEIFSVFIHLKTSDITNKYFMTLNKNLLPIPVDQFLFYEYYFNGMYSLNMVLNAELNDFVTFGIYK